MKCTFACGVALAASVSLSTESRAALFINEIFGNQTGTDTAEFIELYNSGPSAADIGGYDVALFDSDTGTTFGGADGGSPFAIPAGTTIAAGGFYLFGSEGVSAFFPGVTPDQTLGANAVENSSYTALLRDPTDNTVDSLFVTDGGTTDTPNAGGSTIVPNGVTGPALTGGLPAGAARFPDGSTTLVQLLDDGSNATPGASNVPEPTGLALLGVAALAGLRRRRGA